MSRESIYSGIGHGARAKSRFKRRAWFFALVYMMLSIGMEIVLIVIFRLRVPQDNRIIAPVILTLPPVLAAWLCGYRRPGQLVSLALLATLLTVLITVTVNKLTGIKTGLAEPIVNRLLAGFLAGWLINKRLGP